MLGARKQPTKTKAKTTRKKANTKKKARETKMLPITLSILFMYLFVIPCTRMG